MELRDFLFLDTLAVDNYISTIDGFVTEGSIEQTETGTKETGGGINIKAVSASRTSGDSLETKRKLAVTNAAKFQYLYDRLLDLDKIQYLDGFDQEIWDQLRRGEILEIQAQIRLPKALLMMHDAQNFTQLLGFMQMLGQNPLQDAQTKAALEGIQLLGKFTEDQPIPLIFEAISTPGFSFLAHLPKKLIQRELADLQGEGVVFGKVQRIIQKKDKLEVFSLFPAITQASMLNEEQRRKMRQDAVEKNIIEEVQGPAIVLTPLAVYR